MKKILYVLLFVIPSISFADDGTQYDRTKVGMNFLTMMVLGDVNIQYERQVAKQVSIAGSYHYLTGSSVIDALKSSGMRLSVGGRAYIRSDLMGSFFEFKLGNNFLTDKDQEYGGFTAETYFGVSDAYNDLVFYEGKVGVLRYLSQPEMAPGVSLTVGMYF